MAAKTGPKRTDIQRERDYEEIAKLYCQGKLQHEIAARLGLDQSQISRDLQEIQRRWRASAVRNIDEVRSAELAKLDQLEREYWDAWLDSRQEKQTSSSERSTSQKDGERTKASLKKEQKEGNAAFLAGVQWCIERRCKILGIDAPVKQQITGPGNGPVQTVDISALAKLSDDELEYLERISTRLAGSGVPTSDSSREGPAAASELR